MIQMDKADFIIQLLGNSRLNAEQRQKVLDLAKRDYLSSEGRLDEILERIQHIENEVGVKTKPKRDKVKLHSREEFLGDEDFLENIDFDNIQFTEAGDCKKRALSQFQNNFKPIKKKKLSLKDMAKSAKADDINEEEAEQNREDINDAKVDKISIKYIDPAVLYRYLFHYNQNPVLKSTCHEIDSSALKSICEYCETEEYDFEIHLKKITEAFQDHWKKYFVSPNIGTRIKVYLTGTDFKNEVPETGWSNNISLNWSSKEIKEWAQVNKGIPPNIDKGLRKINRKTGYEFSPPILKNDKVIQNFSDLVLFFKHSFHIRRANSLKDIILLENKSNHWDEKIKFEINDSEFPTNIDFFTDVDKLKQAYNRIIELILDIEANKNIDDKIKVQLKLSENDDSVDLSITHLGSIYGKSIYNIQERPIGDSYWSLIKNQINGVCDLIVEADFEDGDSYRVGIWDKLSSSEKITFTSIKPVGGVKHILKFIKGK
jgi:hypothetical protein